MTNRKQYTLEEKISYYEKQVAYAMRRLAALHSQKVNADWKKASREIADNREKRVVLPTAEEILMKASLERDLQGFYASTSRNKKRKGA